MRSRLYREGLAPLVVVTGGVGRGDTTSEALVGRALPAWPHGVPDRRRGGAGRGAHHQGLDERRDGAGSAPRGLRRVLLVSDPFHMFRLRLEARRTALEAYTSPTESSPISDNPVLELRYLFAEGFKVPVALGCASWSTAHGASISTERLYTGRIVNLDRRHGALSRRLHRAAGDAAAPGRLGGGAVPRRRRASADPRVAADPAVPPRGRRLHLGGAGRAGSTPASRPRTAPARELEEETGMRAADGSSGSPRSTPRRASPTSGSISSWRRGWRTARSSARPTSSWSCTRCRWSGVLGQLIRSARSRTRRP